MEINVEAAELIVKWVSWLLLNSCGLDLINQVYGDGHAQYYLDEKISEFGKDRFTWYLNLDSDHRKRVIRLAFKRYNRPEKNTGITLVEE